MMTYSLVKLSHLVKIYFYVVFIRKVVSNITSNMITHMYKYNLYQ